MLNNHLSAYEVEDLNADDLCIGQPYEDKIFVNSQSVHGEPLVFHHFENFAKERLSAGLVCWKERTNLIPKDIINCSLSPKSQMIQSRTVQGNDFSKPQMSTII